MNLIIQPSLHEVAALAEAKPQHYIPIYTELLSDIKTPIEVMRILKNVSAHCYMLESMADSENWGRYTFLGYDPKLSVTCLGGRLQVGPLQIDTDDPAHFIRQIVAEHQSVTLEGLPSFTGGLVGYFGYDFIKYSEPSLTLDADDEEGFNDLDLMLFDKVICFDHYRHKLLLIVNVPLKDYQASYNRAGRILHEMADLIVHGEPAKETAGVLKSAFRPLFDEASYCAMIEEAKRHIFEGDIFQVVLSNRLDADYEGSLLNVYRILRVLNPSPYMFYFSGTDVEIAGASPETLVKLEQGRLHTFPLAGTRPRGKTPAEDLALEKDLLADAKELAEHDMLVDLGRNDLGKISVFGSVEVEKYHAIERFSHVMHIGSTVAGNIRPDCDALDAISAVLPAGTLSGAPKLKACEIINRLENNKRGIYGGAIGYIDFSGNMDTCIAIRLAYKKNGKLFIRSGAGIVADSDAHKEYTECINKAAAVVKAVEDAQAL